MTNINDFDPNLLNIDQVLFNKNSEVVMYDIKCVENLSSLNSLYLSFNNLQAKILMTMQRF